MPANKLRTIVIDDDSLARSMIIELIKRHDQLDLKAEFEDAISAIGYLKENEVDLIFLDIAMPEMDGLEFIELLKYSLPYIIVTTSHHEYAVTAFDYNISGYLIKPISLSNFYKAVAKVLENFGKSQNAGVVNESMFIRTGKVIQRINFDDLLYVECIGDYSTLYLKNDKFIVHKTMKFMEEQLNNGDFVRIHRSYIINKSKISRISDDCIIINEVLLPIGKTYKQDVLNNLNIL